MNVWRTLGWTLRPLSKHIHEHVWMVAGYNMSRGDILGVCFWTYLVDPGGWLCGTYMCGRRSYVISLLVVGSLVRSSEELNKNKYDSNESE